MSRYVVQVARQSLTGLPKDQAENVFHFSSATAGAGTVPEATACVTALASFFDTAHTTGGGPALQSYLSPAWSETTIIKVYDEDNAVKPKPVLYTGNFTITTSGNPLPETVALCMSYRSTENAPRHRGRIFIGPLSDLAMDTNYTEQDAGLIESRPSLAFQAALAGAGGFLRGALAGGVLWCVRSGIGAGTWAVTAKHTATTKTQFAGTRIITYEPVQAGWVENEWDTQRRRHIASTARAPF
jgi:hypothetical protein